VTTAAEGKAIENVKDAVDPKGPVEKAGEKVDEALGKALFATGEPAWPRAATECAPKLPADIAQTVIHKALQTAIESRDGGLVELTFSAIGLANLTDPAPLIPLVESIPDGEPDSDWANAKQQALADLRAPKAGK